MERFTVDVVRLLDAVQLQPDLVERLGSSDALADQTLRDGERVRLGLLLEPTRELGSVFRLRLPLRRFAFDAEPLELLASAATRISDRSISFARDSIWAAAASAAAACDAASAAVRRRSSESASDLTLANAVLKASASCSAWYTIALYVADHSLFSCVLGGWDGSDWRDWRVSHERERSSEGGGGGGRMIGKGARERGRIRMRRVKVSTESRAGGVG